MASVYNVAWYILDKCGEMTTLKLQKLCYYCQAWSLAWDGKPLFDEDFEAWANGPVCRQLFNLHKGKFTVSSEFLKGYKYDDFDKDEIETMDAVLRDLGDKKPQWLKDLTHSERPWIEARGGCEEGEMCTNIISKDEMQEYYGGLGAGV